MGYTPVTPFRRTMDAVLLKHQAHAEKELPPSGANKWEVLRELAAAREALALSDRDMTVLQALVSFYQGTILGGNNASLVVHPSNKSICERLNGMPSSTMRRHLARLVHAGIVLRRDSPNGKRYARRYGDEKVAFGFDLSPLVARFEEFCTVAEVAREAETRFKRLRETVSLMRRDLAGLAEYGKSARPELAVWDRFSDLAVRTARNLRRKLSIEDLANSEVSLGMALEEARDILDPPETTNMSTSESHNEQHYQNSNKDSYESEPCLRKATGTDVVTKSQSNSQDDGEKQKDAEDAGVDGGLPNVPLGLVLASCREILTYADGGIRHWHELVRAAAIVRPMMGISPSAWDEAKRDMGPEEASVVIAAMLERFSDIRSPGGYLRNLSSKAALGEFSCGPMVMALMRRAAA
ncbi:plasmid replication protein RepC [Sedimentitalea sp.]|uniref:plasmid replication protein RepC n=1 Tax=Sedimentitalea sp. TaxID=2048915 RepID=UPI003296CB17